ncbi:MAG TPA: chromate efflux transporter [Acidocella sp.]|jgi:chromate transporter|uniref:chromate efflux transporter n=1 Tax=Acidocella sp. TaxID=50710 RepID=UPI002C79ED51|nr:chromate efflux transporter [Acidocella sp.]HVE20909.1 chromate efflux transporter [Acidocella sp.]
MAEYLMDYRAHTLDHDLQTDEANAVPSVPPLPTLGEATRVWIKIGCLSFGGPAGQIALLHREVVDVRRWVSDRRFLQALNFCHLLPGPEAQQLAIYLGWLMHGPIGGFSAGLWFVIPGAIVMLVLSMIYATFGAVPVIVALFYGLKSAVLVLVVEAVLRIGRRALKGGVAWTLAGISFAALFLFNVPFPIVVLAAGLIGLSAPGYFAGGTHGKAKDGPPALLDAVLAADPGRAERFARGARIAGLASAALWLMPVGLLLPVGGVYADIAWFFSKMAVVTFGGAYAVLAYVAQEAVRNYHWLSAPEMLSGLGLAETTPGPLILVLQFVGFLAGYRAPDSLSGIPGGVAASILTLWVTFLPCFTFVFLGAPLLERLQGNRKLSGALSAVTAAVVGVVANLAVWFALHVLFRTTMPVRELGMSFDAPVFGSLNPWAFALAIVAGMSLLRLKLGVMPTLAICSAASTALYFVGRGV